MLAERCELKGTRGSGIVLASYGRGVLVQSRGNRAALRPHGTQAAGRMRRSGRVGVCDRRPTAPSVESIEPRRNLIERIDARGRAEPVAANIDRLAIVVAPEPAPDWFLVDRYWAGAHLKDIAAMLIVNKSDLGSESIQSELANYRALGLECREVAVADGCRHRRPSSALADRRDLVRRPVGRRQVLDRQCACCRMRPRKPPS